MLIGAPSSNAGHTNAPSLNLTLATSASEEDPYGFRIAQYGNLPSAEGRWQRFSHVFTAAQLAAWTGEYVQVRFVKNNANSTHRIHIDDAFFGSMDPPDAVAAVFPAAGKHEVAKTAMGAGLVYSWYPDAMFADGNMAHIIRDIGLGVLRWPGGAPTTFYHWDNLNGQGWMDNWNPAYDPASDQPPEAFMDLDEYLALIDETGAEMQMQFLEAGLDIGLLWALDVPRIDPARTRHVTHVGEAQATALWMWLLSKATGMTVVQSTPPLPGTAILAAKDGQGGLAVFLLNKTDGDLVVELDLSGHEPGTVSEAWRFLDGGRGAGVLEKIEPWEAGGRPRMLLKADTLNMVGFGLPDAVPSGRPAYRAAVVEPVPDGLLAGWHTSARTDDLSAPGVVGSLLADGLFEVDATGGSTDGTFGIAHGGASAAPTAYAVRGSNSVDTLGIQIVNRTGAPLRLDAAP